MGRKLIALLLALVWLAACSSGGVPTPTPMSEGGLKRKGLSSSEVDLPWTQPDAEAQLRVITARTFRHLGEAVHVLGEVENTADTKMTDVTIEVVGYAAGNRVLDTKEGEAYFEVVGPGERVPYRVFFDARDVKRTEITITAKPTDSEAPEQLPVSDVSITPPAQGYTHVTGQLQSPSEGVKATLIIILRDQDGEAVEVHRAKLIKPLKAGANEFDVLALHHGAASADVTAFVQ